MANRLEHECRRAAARARSMQIVGFGWRIEEGDAVVLEGDALTPDAIDSATKLFRAMTSAREVHNRMRHAPPDPTRPQALYAGLGYVRIVNLGPHAARLAESIVWKVEPGDTLESIAEAVYGSRADAHRIATANPSFVGPDGYVAPGHKLRIPAR